MSRQMLTPCEAKVARRIISTKELLALLLLRRPVRVTRHTFVIRTIMLLLISIHINILRGRRIDGLYGAVRAVRVHAAQGPVCAICTRRFDRLCWRQWSLAAETKAISRRGLHGRILCAGVARPRSFLGSLREVDLGTGRRRRGILSAAGRRSVGGRKCRVDGSEGGHGVRAIVRGDPGTMLETDGLGC